VKYDWIFHEIFIFTFLSCVLKVIFWLIFFPSYNLDKASNIFLGVVNDDTWGIK
jgi:hypothetical protein